jgi:hypothetical protein
VPTFDDVRRIALALPEATETLSRGHAQWRVKDKNFVWERPLRRSDLEALGDAAPDGPILGVRTEHLMAKDAMLADDPEVFFTTPHFDGYPAVLVRMDRISAEDLTEVIVEAWVARAPEKLAAAFLDERADDRPHG